MDPLSDRTKHRIGRKENKQSIVHRFIADLEEAHIFLLLLLFIVLFRPIVDHSLASVPLLGVNDIQEKGGVVQDNASIKKIGIDVSFYQGKIDWSTTATHVDFVYLKATDGITYQDPRFNVNAQALGAQNTPHGAYHFFEPNDDPIKQAKNYLHTIRDYKLALRPVVDIEISKGFKPQSIARNLRLWLEYVEKEIGCKPMIYSYASFWDTYIGSKFNAYPFWLADYSTKPQPPHSRSDWQLWQYSQSGRVVGIDSSVDMDRFVGDQQAFDRLFCQPDKEV
mgnify:CR=1 FL=1